MRLTIFFILFAVVCSAQTTHKLLPTQNIVDGKLLNVKGGDKIEIPTTHTTPLRFINIIGTKESPVTISGGSVTVPINLSYGIKFETSRYFRLTETKVTGGNIGITVEKLSSDFEIDHNTVSGTGFAGIMAKDDQAKRGEFVMRNVYIHHNNVSNTGGEGLYIGNSSYSKGTCHELENVYIFSNFVKDTGWDGIQLGATPHGGYIFNNQIENYGRKSEGGQNNGIQIGEGTGGICGSNRITGGTGNGIIVLGSGSNFVNSNTIINSGNHGIFADNRTTLAGNFTFESNLIINPKGDGMRIYADPDPLQFPDFIVEITGNTIVNPGSNFFLSLLPTVKVKQDGNYFVK